MTRINVCDIFEQVSSFSSTSNNSPVLIPALPMRTGKPEVIMTITTIDDETPEFAITTLLGILSMKRGVYHFDVTHH